MVERKSLDELEILSPKELGIILCDVLDETVLDMGYVKCVLDAGASLNVMDNTRGWPPIFFAIKSNHIEALKLLLDAGADLEVKETTGWTALHLATGHDNLEAVKLLIKAGANKHALNNDGYTPYFYRFGHVKAKCPQLNPNYNG